MIIFEPCFVVFFRLTGKKQNVMNFGSYNYLGFAEKEGPCKDAVETVTTEYGVSSMGSRQELGKGRVTMWTR